MSIPCRWTVNARDTNISNSRLWDLNRSRQADFTQSQRSTQLSYQGTQLSYLVDNLDAGWNSKQFETMSSTSESPRNKKPEQSDWDSFKDKIVEGLKAHLGTELPKLVMIFDDVTERSEDDDRKLLREQLLDIVTPSNVLLITGERNKAIDSLVREKLTANGKQLEHKEISVESKGYSEAKKSTNEAKDNADKRNLSAVSSNPQQITSENNDEGGIQIDLQMYYRGKSYHLKYRFLKTESENIFGSPDSKSHPSESSWLAKIPGKQMAMKSLSHLFCIHLSYPNNDSLEVKLTSERMDGFDILMDPRVTSVKLPKESKSLSEKDDKKSVEVKIDKAQFHKSLLTEIFKVLIKATNSTKKETEKEKKDKEQTKRNKAQDLFDIFVERWYDEIKDLLRALLNDVSKGKSPEFYFDGDVREDWIDEFVKSEKEKQKDALSSSDGTTEEPGEADRSKFKKNKLLLIFCVQNGLDRNLYTEFWNKGENKLAMVLKAYRTSKSMHKKHKGSELGDTMERQMKCFEKNDDVTFELLLGCIPDLRDATPIDIALDANFYGFIAETPCQELLDHLWTEPLENPNKGYYTFFIVSAIFPFLSPLLMNFTEESKLFSIASQKEQNKKFKDNYSITESCCISTVEMIDGGCLPEESRLCMIPCIPYIFGSHYFWLIRCFFVAPIVRFTYVAISQLLYLILFSIVMLSDFQVKISNKEIVLDAWTLILAIEEIKQIISDPKEYLDMWNMLDSSGLIVFLVGFIIRIIFHASPSNLPEGLYVARNVFAFSLMIFILRTLQLMSINRRLGPKIYMISSLLKDLISFMLILAVFVVAYGIGSNIILYPNQPINIYLLRDIFYDSWWSVLQQFNRDDALGANCNKEKDSIYANITADYCSSATALDVDYVSCKKNKCPANDWIVAILLVVYAIIAVIMMLNVLIAMFNEIYSSVQQKREEVYSLESYQLMHEYCAKTGYPVPLCVITYWRIIPWLIQKCWTMSSKKNKNEPRRTIFSENWFPLHFTSFKRVHGRPQKIFQGAKKISRGQIINVHRWAIRFSWGKKHFHGLARRFSRGTTFSLVGKKNFKGNKNFSVGKKNFKEKTDFSGWARKF